MRKKRVNTLPKCNFCKKDARFDAPTKTGRWAFMCPKHTDMYVTDLSIGTEFILGIAEPVGGKAINGELDMERSMSEYLLIIFCPECKDEKHLEFDAEGAYVCDGCGKTVTIPAFM